MNYGKVFTGGRTETGTETETEIETETDTDTETETDTYLEERVERREKGNDNWNPQPPYPLPTFAVGDRFFTKKVSNIECLHPSAF